MNRYEVTYSTDDYIYRQIFITSSRNRKEIEKEIKYFIREKVNKEFKIESIILVDKK